MNIIHFLKSYFASKSGCTLSKSLLTLIVAHYDVNYIIYDRRSGEELDESIEYYDARHHTIWVENEEAYCDMFAVV